VSHSTWSRNTCPRPKRLICAKGWKIVCRHAGPPFSVMIGAITLTSWARQAAFTRSAWLRSEMQAPPKASASSIV
jgi:hypothetical protein